jgi:glycosyltransferase involved in cell wall biosynthesis
MKILYIGTETFDWVIDICNAIGEQGHEVIGIIQNKYGYNTEIKHQGDNVRFLQVSPELTINPESFFKLIQKVYDSKKPDFVFCSHYPNAPMVAELKLRTGCVAGAMILDVPSDLIKKDEKRQKIWQVLKNCLNSLDLVIVNTEIAREELSNILEQEIPKENMILYGIGLPAKYENSGINKKGDYVVSVCRINRIKNCVLIPQALSYLDLKLKYVAVGVDENEEVSILKDLCERYGIEFEHKSQISDDEKFELIKNSSMLIYPQNSEYIGGLSPFEAMWCGKPAIAPDLPIYNSLYLDNAYYFDNNNARDLANKIGLVHTYKRGAFKAELLDAHDYVKNNLSYATMAKKLIERMEQTLNDVNRA